LIAKEEHPYQPFSFSSEPQLWRVWPEPDWLSEESKSDPESPEWPEALGKSVDEPEREPQGSSGLMVWPLLVALNLMIVGYVVSVRVA
jgi:hypothetical protein